MKQPTLDQLNEAAAKVHAVMPPTPQYVWPLLRQRTGADVWVKHENHTPIGAFKLRGGIVYIGDRAKSGNTGGVISATRGNHGQSIATACGAFGIPATIVVPEGNSREKNAAMRAQGATLIEHGSDFQDAFEFAKAKAKEDALDMVPSFHEKLVHGVASYALEFFRASEDLDAVYVPVGLGSGICGVISARNALGLKTEIVGVVSDRAPTYALSVEAGKPVPTNDAITFADGVALRVPNEEALAFLSAGVSRLVRVTEEEIADAMRIYYTDTHNVAEGAGAVPLAGFMKERGRYQGKSVGLVLSGGNVDRDVYGRILVGETP